MRPFLVGPGYTDLIRNTPGKLIGYWRMREQASTSTVMRDELGITNGVYSATPPPRGIGTPIKGGTGAAFDGGVHYAQIAKDLSAYAQISLSFWLWWDAFSSVDDMAFEYTATAITQNGFFIDPDTSSSATFSVVISHTGHFWYDSFPRPTASAWHHYLFTMNRATPLNAVCVDGRAQTMTTIIHDVFTYSTFANSTLNVMCRNAASNFGAGRMTEVALWGGNILTPSDAAMQYSVGMGR